MTETFLFVRLGEGEVYRNVVWKLQKCYDGVRGQTNPWLVTLHCCGAFVSWKKYVNNRNVLASHGSLGLIKLSVELLLLHIATYE